MDPSNRSTRPSALFEVLSCADSGEPSVCSVNLLRISYCSFLLSTNPAVINFNDRISFFATGYTSATCSKQQQMQITRKSLRSLLQIVRAARNQMLRHERSSKLSSSPRSTMTRMKPSIRNSHRSQRPDARACLCRQRRCARQLHHRRRRLIDPLRRRRQNSRPGRRDCHQRRDVLARRLWGTYRLRWRDVRPERRDSISNHEWVLRCRRADAIRRSLIRSGSLSPHRVRGQPDGHRRDDVVARCCSHGARGGRNHACVNDDIWRSERRSAADWVPDPDAGRVCHAERGLKGRDAAHGDCGRRDGGLGRRRGRDGLSGDRAVL